MSAETLRDWLLDRELARRLCVVDVRDDDFEVGGVGSDRR